MNALINFLTLMTLLFAGLAQSGSLSRGLGYGVAGACAGVTVILAIVRYKQRKAAGE
ncbi:MAG: hypothetical protein JST92_03485 [Deltaproteobacteria bacterium]|nr:hypothetical protein [Deltaproteobacteria bacterium]